MKLATAEPAVAMLEAELLGKNTLIIGDVVAGMVQWAINRHGVLCCGQTDYIVKWEESHIIFIPGICKSWSPIPCMFLFRIKPH